MGFDFDKTLDSFSEGIMDTAEFAHTKTNEFHENYVSTLVPDCGKYGDAAKFAAEMVPGVAEYNAIKDGDWTAFAIAAGLDIAAIAVGAFTAGAGYAAVKGGSNVAKAGVKVAVKEVAEAGAKKAIKETAEAGAKKIAKETAEEGIKKAVKETAEAGVEKVAKEAVEAGAEKATKEVVEAGTEKIVKETTEATVEKVAKETAETATKETVETGTEVVSKEAAEKIKEGGSYREIKKSCDGATHEVHHMPADGASPLDKFDGPAIKMEKLDHQKTASWGNSIEARDYRKMQSDLIENGKFREAVELDIQDIKSKFPSKYDEAIKDMLEYVNKLELEGIIK